MSTDRMEIRPQRPGRRMLVRAFLAALVVVVASAATVATAALLELKSVSDWINEGSGRASFNTSALDKVDPAGPQTILLLGADRRWGGYGAGGPIHSDTMMLVHLDAAEGISVLSIPRDLKVKIPGTKGYNKINAAMAIGGPELAIKTVKQLFGPRIKISHAVTVNFRGFRHAVDRLGCVYTDVDRHYFNDNSPPFGGGPNYAVINVKAGYQRLCGQQALDYVRYRHFDNDIVRSARQQQFLDDAKTQIGSSEIWNKRKQLIRLFGRYTDTDIHDGTTILRLLKLVVGASGEPVRRIEFPADIGSSYVTVTPQHLEQTVDDFLNAGSVPEPAARRHKSVVRPRRSTRRRKSSKSTKKAAPTPGLIAAPGPAQDIAIKIAPRARFTVYYPKLLAAGGSYVAADSRGYDIFDRARKRYTAYRIVVRTGTEGQDYGVQGMTWKDPPILQTPSIRYRMAGRTYSLYKDGGRLRLVAWRTPKAVYWVSNTLLRTLTDAQMLAIARSMARVN